MLQVIDRGQGVLHDLGHIRFHLTGAGTRVGGHDRDVGRVHFWKLVDRQFQEAVYADDDDRHKDKDGGYRLLDS